MALSECFETTIARAANQGKLGGRWAPAFESNLFGSFIVKTHAPPVRLQGESFKELLRVAGA